MLCKQHVPERARLGHVESGTGICNYAHSTNRGSSRHGSCDDSNAALDLDSYECAQTCESAPVDVKMTTPRPLVLKGGGGPCKPARCPAHAPPKHRARALDAVRARAQGPGPSRSGACGPGRAVPPLRRPRRRTPRRPRFGGRAAWGRAWRRRAARPRRRPRRTSKGAAAARGAPSPLREDAVAPGGKRMGRAPPRAGRRAALEYKARVPEPRLASYRQGSHPPPSLRHGVCADKAAKATSRQHARVGGAVSGRQEAKEKPRLTIPSSRSRARAPWEPQKQFHRLAQGQLHRVSSSRHADKGRIAATQPLLARILTRSCAMCTTRHVWLRAGGRHYRESL